MGDGVHSLLHLGNIGEKILGMNFIVFSLILFGSQFLWAQPDKNVPHKDRKGTYCQVYAKPSHVQPGETFTLHWDTDAKKPSFQFKVKDQKPKGSEVFTATKTKIFMVEYNDSLPYSCWTQVFVGKLKKSPHGTLTIKKIHQQKNPMKKTLLFEAKIKVKDQCPEKFYIQRGGVASFIGPKHPFTGRLVQSKLEKGLCILEISYFPQKSMPGTYQYNLIEYDKKKKGLGKVYASTLVTHEPSLKK